MRSIRRILVAVKDPDARAVPAIAKAAQLARAFGAQLELFHALDIPVYIGGIGVPKSAPTHVVRDARARILRSLDRMAARVGRSGLKVSTAMEADFPPYEAVVRRASRLRADLVVADCHAGRHAIPWLLELTDWELLRHSAVPVLLVRNRRNYRRPVVLAAVDPTHAHAKPTALDRVILQAGRALATATRGALHAVHAFAPPDYVFAGGMMSPQVSNELMRQAESRAHNAFAKLLRSWSLPARRRHLVFGQPVEAIPATARAVGADIIVMGAISRSGIRSLLIGNTAESLLDRLPCDVLVVKPPGFRSKVARARRGPRYVGAPLPFAF
jgi:universal stress protein E